MSGAKLYLNNNYNGETSLPNGKYRSSDLTSGSHPLINSNGAPQLSSYKVGEDSKLCLYTEDNFSGLIDDLPKTGDVPSMGIYNDKVKSLKIKPVCKPCGDNDNESFNNTDSEYFQNEPSKVNNNTNLYLLLLLLIIAYFFFYKK